MLLLLALVFRWMMTRPTEHFNLRLSVMRTIMTPDSEFL